MTSNRFISSKNLLTVVFMALLVGLAAFSFSIWQTPSYKSTVKLLAVFNQTSIDTYTASKTANYITGILGEVVYSDSFINSVYGNDGNLIDNLGRGSEKRQKNWNKIVKLKILDNKGIIIIDVYGNDKTQTNLLASSIGSTIISQHGLYDGSQDRVSIKMIDLPSIYENWAATKIIEDTGLGMIVGLLLGFTLIVVFPNHKLFEFKKKDSMPVKLPLPVRQDRAQAGLIAPKEALPESQPASAVENVSGQFENQTGRISNPWLDQYYEENLPANDDINRYN